SWLGRAALAVSLVVQLVDASRLRRLTEMHRLGLSIWDVLKISLATQFYGLALPGGSLSGIAVRCSQLSTHERKVGAGISLLVLFQLNSPNIFPGPLAEGQDAQAL